MKILKVLLIVLVILAGLVFIIPVFLPSSATVSVETEIEVAPELIFHNAAQFTNRDQWDPWLETEPTADVEILPRNGYIGSTYAWDGEKIGSGKMRIDSVSFPSFIGSSIWFGESPDPSQVEWIIEPMEAGSKVTWKFTSQGTYPFGKWMLVFIKGALESSFEKGMANYKTFLEENPPVMYRLSEISLEESYATNALVIAIEGTMEEIGPQMMTGFPELYQEVEAQGLTPAGPAFAHYLDFDEAANFSHVLLGAPVNKEGKASGRVVPKFYEKTKAVAATHYGKYDYFRESYDAIGKFIMDNNLEVTGEAFEVYINGAMESENPMDWETMIAFPLK